MKSERNSSYIGLQFRIVLDDVMPLVWRRIVMPKDATFFELHAAIQNAMGWSDTHGHEFNLTFPKRGASITIRLPNPEDDSQFEDERTACVLDYLDTHLCRWTYVYDFGDDWRHSLFFEGEQSIESKLPVCLDGERACPPEDCGGALGYEDLRRVLAAPIHPEKRELVDWLGIERASDFNPDAFDASLVTFKNPKRLLREYEQELKDDNDA